MVAFDIRLAHHYHRVRPKLLTGFGLLTVLAIVAVAFGAALGFAV
jgi:hypothetical protein